MSRSDGVFNEFCDGAWEKREKKEKVVHNDIDIRI